MGRNVSLARWPLALVLLAVACPRGAGAGADVKEPALKFTRLLVDRDYAAAYAMTAKAYRARLTPQQMQAEFERFVPPDFALSGELKVMQTTTDWPAREKADVGRAYVAIPGDAYSEGVTVVVASEAGNKVIRDVEWGRP